LASQDDLQLLIKISIHASVPFLTFVKMQVDKLLLQCYITSSTWSHKEGTFFEFWQIWMEKEIVCQIYIICRGSTFQFFPI